MKKIGFFTGLLALLFSNQIARADEKSLLNAAQSLSYAKKINTEQFAGKAALFDNSANPGSEGYKGTTMIGTGANPLNDDSLETTANQYNFMLFRQTSDHGVVFNYKPFGERVINSQKSDSAFYIAVVDRGQIDSTWFNHSPFVKNAVGGQTIASNAGEKAIAELNQMFGDADNDNLAYTVSVSDTAKASARIVNGVLYVTAKDSGATSVTVNGKDGNNYTATQTIPFSFVKPTTSVDEIANSIPEGFKLNQNYPNPFNPSTTISFVLPYSSNVSLSIFNELGQKVDQLLNETMGPGTYQKTFVGKDKASGVYWYMIEATTQDGKKFVDTKKMVELK